MIFMEVIKLRKNIEKYFLENGWTDSDKEKICYELQWKNVLEKYLIFSIINEEPLKFVNIF